MQVKYPAHSHTLKCVCMRACVCVCERERWRWCFKKKKIIALFSALEQTHCNRMWFLQEWLAFYSVLLNIHRSGVLTVTALAHDHSTMLHPPPGTGCQTHSKMQKTLHLFGSSWNWCVFNSLVTHWRPPHPPHKTFFLTASCILQFLGSFSIHFVQEAYISYKWVNDTVVDEWSIHRLICNIYF